MPPAKAKQETISSQVKLSTWNLLNPSQRAMLKGMGFSPLPQAKEPKVIRKNKALRTLKEYYIIAAVSCRLCDNTTVESYKMEQQNYSPGSPGEPHLKAIPVTYEEAVGSNARIENHSRPVCVACRTKLMEKTKEELITSLINFAKYDALRR